MKFSNKLKGANILLVNFITYFKLKLEFEV